VDRPNRWNWVFYRTRFENLSTEKIVRNVFETAHTKGPQDAAGGFLKNQADLAVVRVKTSIQSAKDFFDFCNENIYCFWYDFACDKLVYEFEIFTLYTQV
jgi:dihydroorotate dehydrogenase